MPKNVFCLILLSFLFCFSCNQPKIPESGQEVLICEYLEPGMLNPVSNSDVVSIMVMDNIFHSLLSVDYNNLQPTPILAKSRPDIITLPDGTIEISYNLRPEARWDDGSPITAKDVEFSLKLRKVPLVDNLRFRSIFDFIKDFKHYQDDPLKFTLVGKEAYLLAEGASGDFSILPQKVYDPENFLGQFSLKEIIENYDDLHENEDLKRFANEFNSEKYKKDKNYINGSGAYVLEAWEPGNRLVLKKKENWWGDKLAHENLYFKAIPKHLVYNFISDPTTALVALKSGQVDVLRNIKSNDFIALPKSEKFNESFVAYTPDQMECHYIGLNHNNPKLQDVNTRKALAYLLDVDKLIQVVHYGMATRMVGPIHPLKTMDYAHEIEPYKFDVDKAKNLLALAGWADSNNNGILDKIINGQRVELELVYHYTAGSDERKYIGLILQEEARKAGVKIKLEPMEGLALMEKVRQQNFDIFYGAFGFGPGPQDFKQILHSESCITGANYFGYRSKSADALIEKIRVELNNEKRAVLNKELQAVLHEELPCIFLFSRKEKIAIHKKYKSPQTSVVRPGYWAASFSVD